MFEVMNTGYEAPIEKGLTFKYSFPVQEFPTTKYVTGIGTTESGDIVLHANADARSVIYSKNESGIFTHKQTANNSGNVGGYAVAMPGGFVVSTPNWPNERGSLSTWMRQSDGSYLRTMNPKETGYTRGQLGQYGGLAAAGNHLFSSAQFDGTFLVTFKTPSSSEWNFVSADKKEGSGYFASFCIRKLSDTEIVTAAPYETVGAFTNSGAIYVLGITASGPVEKQRITPSISYTSGMFGYSIIVINPNRFVATSNIPGTSSVFHTFERPNASSPFVETSVTVVPDATLTNSNNFLHYKGLILSGNGFAPDQKGRSISLSIDASGKVEYLPNLKMTGTQVGQQFGVLQAISGNQVFYVSQWKNDSGKYSTVSVYDMQT